ncbi:MAG: class I SAM-dependent methyltransferase [Candidatus Omnitrophica bacterium]|nr:class I SAM-dependent methyltransferase [Candidatus Omnitrophota bacterium]MDD5774430.1 class I SAM-dependent methyltransferase [Candidatus Omnitrophota bacterium]
MTDYILDFWDRQAATHGTSFKASWADNYAISLEIENIGACLSKGDRVLDVGCANGHSAFQHLKKGIASITGVDFSQNMIDQAEKKKKGLSKRDRSRITFEKGDVRSLRFGDGSFDVVYTTRVLINLPTWAQQRQGLDECLRVCRAKGTVIISEGFWEPLVRLNALRALVNLAPLGEHDFNRYLKKEYLEKYLASLHKRYTAIDFSSVYYLGSRFLRELVTIPGNYPGYSNPINKIFYGLEKKYSGGGLGIQQAYIIKK